ncbi:DNA excision repair protein ERCC-6-like [Mytilus californianus]|uniref:DNA excision repair protein ERCC-6-like n=1 Tax=Mytilus californianus TaxID=6549 RepID=UPI0022475DC3|nr:DNA excision repair protein ERCC-6-like [Mytilus californianus]
MTEEEQEIFTELITNAKQLTTEGKIKDALDLYRQALKMHYHEKLAKKIGKMEAYLKETGEDGDTGDRSGSSSTDPLDENLSEEDQEIYNQMISGARNLVEQGNIKEALDLNKEALKIYHSEKLARKITKMEMFLKTSGNQGTGNIKSQGTPKAETAQKESISDGNNEIFSQLIQTAKQYTEEGKIKAALELYREALKINPDHDKLAKRIAKIEVYLKQNEEQTNHRTDDDVDATKEETKPESIGGTPFKENISEDNKEIFDQLVQTAKLYTDEGKIKDALELYREALKINPNHDKLAKKIAKIEIYLKETEGETFLSEQKVTEEHKPSNKEKSNVPSETPKKKSVSQEDQENFNQLVQTAKLYTDEGNLKGALELYREAVKIYSSEKLTKKISKIEAYIKENYENEAEVNNTEQSSNGDIKPSVTKTPGKSQNNQNEQDKFNKLVLEAKQLIGDGKVKAALDLNRQALTICHSEKLAKKVAKMEQYLKEHGNEEEGNDEENNGMVHVGNGYFMYKELFEKLYDHQKEAVLWMWGLHKKRKGGILGDDMGLGKTIQVISFLSGLFDMDKVKSVLIVMPVSLIVNWEKEFQKWAPGIRVEAYHGSSKKEKERALGKVQRRGGVLLTSYGLVVTSSEVIGKQDGREFVWDYVALDEGHKIKNPTKTTKGVHAIPAKNRIILTGTPIQNNLKELWALFDFVHQGSLLGTARTFKMEYENPITRARERDATVGERKLGQEMATSLKKIIAPYFLRRTKAEVTETKDGVKVDNSDEGVGKMPSLTRKNDLILWVFLTQTQQKIYHDFLSLDTVKELLMTKKSPLVALTVLKKITDHPRLLSTRAVAQLGLEDHGLDEDQLESEEAYLSAVNQIKNVDDQILINESGKLIVLVELLDKLKEEGHRTLVFSQSRKLLDIIYKVISNRGHMVLRLDGTVTHLSERDQRMQKFQTDERYSVFLLTTQVGGVGLTLTAADRVVIYDPSWNPATDNQAVDRAFRIGQEKNVVIYRLITCGTVEEKIYRRQIFKDSITRQTTGNSTNPYRYFTKQELKELFELNNSRVSSTQQQLEEMHSGFRKTDQSLDAHIAYLYSLDIFGISDHDLMFGKVKDNVDDIDEDNQEECQGNDYIQARVQKAQELLQMESNLSQPMSQYPSEGQSNRPRGPSEWNMPTVTSVPDGGPDDVIDLNKDDDNVDEDSDDDSDTEMVDLTETPQKKTSEDERQRVPPIGHIKQEIFQEIDDDLPSLSSRNIKREESSPRIKLEPSDPAVKKEPESPGINSENSHSEFIDVEIKSEPKSHIQQSEPICLDSDEEIQDSNETNESFSKGNDKTEEILIENNQENSVHGNHDNKNINMENEDDIQNLETSLSNIHCDDDVMMTSPSKTPMKKQTVEMMMDSPMKVDSNEIKNLSILKSPLRSIENLQVDSEEDMNTSIQKTPLKSRGNLNTESEDAEMASPALKSPVKTIETMAKGLGSAVKLFGNQISNTVSSIVNMVTPEKQKTPAKNKRRSVCASPWLAKTPKAGKSNVVNEELLISPDANRPLMSVGKKFNIPLTSQALTEARMNSTIMSAFADSPALDSRSADSSHSSGGSLGENFVEESPSPKKRLHGALVQDSPLNSCDTSRAEESASVVIDSQQNTPAVISNKSVISDLDIDSTPKRLSHSKQSTNCIDDSMNYESDESGKSPEIKSMVDESVNNNSDENENSLQSNQTVESPLNDMSDDNINESPIATVNRKKRKAVIDSSDEDDSEEEIVDEEEEVLEKGGKVQKPSRSRHNVVSDDSDNDSINGAKQTSKVNKKNLIEDESESDDEYDEDDSFIDDDEDDEMSDEEVSESEEDESEEEDFDSLSDDQKKKFSRYVKTGRSMYKNGNYNEALVNILQALEIFPHNEVQALAIKINKKIEES